MRHSFRHTIIIAAAVFGLSGFAAIAASDLSAADSLAAAKATPHAAHQATIEQRIKDMHAKLRITPA
jgi:protein CpxP